MGASAAVAALQQHVERCLFGVPIVEIAIVGKRRTMQTRLTDEAAAQEQGACGGLPVLALGSLMFCGPWAYKCVHTKRA